jgi:hypothetical protein
MFIDLDDISGHFVAAEEVDTSDLVLDASDAVN